MPVNSASPASLSSCPFLFRSTANPPRHVSACSQGQAESRPLHAARKSCGPESSRSSVLCPPPSAQAHRLSAAGAAAAARPLLLLRRFCSNCAGSGHTLARLSRTRDNNNPAYVTAAQGHSMRRRAPPTPFAHPCTQGVGADEIRLGGRCIIAARCTQYSRSTVSCCGSSGFYQTKHASAPLHYSP